MLKMIIIIIITIIIIIIIINKRQRFNELIDNMSINLANQ